MPEHAAAAVAPLQAARGEVGAPERAAATVELLQDADGSAAAAPLRAARSEASALESAVAAVGQLQAADGDAVLPWAASGEAGALERAAATVEVTRPTGAAPCQVTWTADAAAAAATSFPKRGSNPCTLLTDEQCYRMAEEAA